MSLKRTCGNCGNCISERLECSERGSITEEDLDRVRPKTGEWGCSLWMERPTQPWGYSEAKGVLEDMDKYHRAPPLSNEEIEAINIAMQACADCLELGLTGK
jgi:hypothetical protein